MPESMIYFRPGEVSFFLEPTDVVPNPQVPISHDSLADLLTFVSGRSLPPLADDPMWEQQPLGAFAPQGRTQVPLVGDQRLIQSMRLASWVSWTDIPDRGDLDLKAQDAIMATCKFVIGFNDAIRSIPDQFLTITHYRVHGVTPNWLVADQQ